ncbi:MAG: hypothetical protein IJK61_03400 [Bacteroidetes bacterium]|nr:hypothetical protein [Bacteroidota bacterium]
MKTLIINGSPRKNWTIFKILESIKKSIDNSGVITEIFNLYDYSIYDVMA